MNRRELNLPDLDAVIADLRLLHEGGYQQAGSWDLTQVCRHCTDAFNSTVDGFDFKAPAVLKVLIKLMGMKKKMYRTRQIKPGLPAPKETIYPSAEGDQQTEAQAVEELIVAIDRFRNHGGAYAPNPGFGELTRDEWFEFHAIHTMHHLSFLMPNPATAAVA